MFGKDICKQILIVLNKVEDGLSLAQARGNKGKTKAKEFNKKVNDLTAALAKKGLPKKRLLLWSSLNEDNVDAYELFGFEEAKEFREFQTFAL